MARYRSALPQLDGRLFLTDGGIETTLLFHEDPRRFADEVAGPGFRR